MKYIKCEDIFNKTQKFYTLMYSANGTAILNVSVLPLLRRQYKKKSQMWEI